MIVGQWKAHVVVVALAACASVPPAGAELRDVIVNGAYAVDPTARRADVVHMPSSPDADAKPPAMRSHY